MALLALGVLLAALVIGGSPTAKAETGKKALILGSSVTGGASSTEATEAAGDGFTVTVVDDATWGAMTAAQFADYQLVVVGDPTCGLTPAVVSQNATALADAVMARSGGNSKVGNRILIGTDPRFHLGQGGNKLIDTGIAFAGATDGATNLYLNTTCQDRDWDANGTPDVQDKLLPLLTIDPSATWTQNQGPPCGGDVSLISNAAQFATLTSSDLRGWGCSVHETFPQFPTDWSALAIATDTPTAPTCGTDVDSGAARCGEAYVLIAGSGIVSEAPNLSLDPPEATNPVGTQHTVTATVTNPDDTPRSGVEVSFVVTGANAGASGTCVPADCKTDASGNVTFTYTGAAAGDDTINAAITIDGSRQTATAAKTWVEGGGGGPDDREMTGRAWLYDGPNSYNNNKGLRVLVSGVGDASRNRKRAHVFCDAERGGDDLQISWGFVANPTKYVAVATDVTSAACSDSPAGSQGAPAADFDTIEATAQGVMAGEAVTIKIKLADRGENATGEPGRRRDRGSIEITRNSDGAILLGKPERFVGSGNLDAVGIAP
ncbi:MAG: Ig-like domain-containing protein [Solirubrobacterales bacterium]|nr:Ig-like domain-containing protein [Solirubrobacterales bacterium]